MTRNVSNQQQATSPGTSVWVEASAGTGKTKVLVDRILNLLIHENQAPNILCLTFTRSAATEMEERLMERLLSWSIMSEQALQKDLQSLTARASNPDQLRAAQQLYDRVINTEFRPQFHTIHSFCETLLRKFPQEAGVDSNFTVLDEHAAKILLQKAKDIVFQSLQVPKSKKLQRDMACISQYTNSDSFSALLDLLVADRRRLEKFMMANNSNTIPRLIADKLNLSSHASPDSLVNTACANASFDTKGLVSSLHCLETGSKTDQKRAQIIIEWLYASESSRRTLFAKYCTAFLTRDHNPIKRLVSKDILAKTPDILPALENEQSRLRDLTSKIKRAKIVQCTAALLNLTKTILQQFAQEKIKQNCLDYDDLIIKSGIVLTTANTSSWVLYKVDKTIDHLLIDEAQDTSLEQWEIIQALASEFFSGEGAERPPRTIFAVGDYKQSIYSFQRASPESFNKMREYFHSRANDAAAPWADIGLEVSFRSAAPILEAVDLVFEQAFAAVATPDNKTLPPLKHFCWRDQAPGLVELWPVLKPSGDAKTTVRPLPTHVSAQLSPRTQLAQLVARRINTLLFDRSSSHSDNFQPEDIMVLVRRRGPFVFDLLRELKNLNIPVTGIDRMTLADNIGVMDLISLGHFLLNPDDDLSLAEVLKSPLCNLDDKNLFDLAHPRVGSLWDSLRDLDTKSSQLQKARFVLKDMLAKVRHFTPSELYADLLITRNYKKYFVSRLGVECIDPINEFLSKSIEYEATKSSSLEGFIHWLENSNITARRDPTRHNDKSVKILTVHGAKGLESPIVFLPDTVQKSQNNSPLLWPESGTFPIWVPNATLLDPLTREWILDKKKRGIEEYHRLLYVAMTRAKDQLYICGWSETSNVADDCWHNIVSQTLKKVARETNENISDDETTNKISHILQLANFRPKKKAMSHARAPRTKPTSPPPWVRSSLQNHPQQFSYRETSTFLQQSLLPATGRPTGELIAHLVNSLYAVAKSDWETAADKFISRLPQEQGLSGFVKDVTLKILGTPGLSFLFEDNTQGCVPISGPITYCQQTSLFHGSVDRLVDFGDSVLLVNFLVGNNCHSGALNPSDTFLRNIAIKASLAELVFPRKDVTSAILWTDEQKLQKLSHDMLKKCLS